MVEVLEIVEEIQLDSHLAGALACGSIRKSIVTMRNAEEELQ
jgi:hypothetical protein